MGKNAQRRRAAREARIRSAWVPPVVEPPRTAEQVSALVRQDQLLAARLGI